MSAPQSLLSPAVTQQLAHALRGLQYGAVHLVIHDAQIVRIERIERIRLTGSPEASPTIFGQPTPSLEVRPQCSREESP